MLPPRPDTAHPAGIDPLSVTRYTLYRDRVFQEYDLVNHRMMWMVLSQGFMLALWSGLPARPVGDAPGRWVAALVPAGGIVLTLGSLCSIWAAQETVRRLRRSYETGWTVPDRATGAFLPPLIARDGLHRLGNIAPWCMLLFLLCLWVALLAASLGR